MFWLKKRVAILTDEDIMELKNIERVAYMETARELAKLRGQNKARQELSVKQKKEEF
jgi:hypothetical protein